MTQGLVHTPCKLLFLDEENCALSVRFSFLFGEAKKIQAIICDGVIFALNEFSHRLLSELSLDEDCLKAISSSDKAKVEKARNNDFLQKTANLLRPYCQIDDSVVTRPLLMWNK